MNQAKKLFPELAEDNKDEDIPREVDFFVEDWVGRVEKVIRKKEEAEKENNPTSSAPRSSSELKSNIEAEIKQLQDQIKELENKISNVNDAAQKKAYQEILNGSKKDLADKEKEKDKLNSTEPQKPANDNNHKLNLAIGLGVGALVIGLLCLVILASKRKD